MLWWVLELLSKFPEINTLRIDDTAELKTCLFTHSGECSRILREYVLNSSFYSYFNREFSSVSFFVRWGQHFWEYIYIYTDVVTAFRLSQSFRGELHSYYPADIYLLKVNNRSTRTRCKICSKLTHQNGVNSVVLMSLLLTLNIFYTMF